MAELELFFDGECPVCAREVALLGRLDRRGRLAFTDIAAPGFDPAPLGRTQEQLMARFTARTADGRLLDGVEVFRLAWAAVGFGPLVALTRLPGASWLADRAYDVFARNRVRWFGRSCDEGRCERPRRGAAPAGRP